MIPIGPRWVAVAAAAVGLALGSSVVAAATPAKAPAAKKFCDAYANNATLAQQMFLADPGSDAVTALNAKLAAGITAAKAAAPAAVADAYNVGTSDSATDFTEIAAAQKAIDTWLLAHCNYEVVKLVADDSSVKMAKTLKPGFVAFDVTNKGTTARYYGVVPVAAGQTVAQLLATPLEQLRPRVLTQAVTSPGQEAVAYAQITKPGVYVVIDGNSVGTPQPSYTSFTVKK